MTPEERAPEYVDYSQYYAYSVCPWKWFERAVNKTQRAFPAGKQRDDNMAVGSLVHDGLQSWYEWGVPEVTAKVIEEINPTPEAFALANSLLQGFVRQYPVEIWKLERCEEPVRAPLTPAKYSYTCNDCCAKDYTVIKKATGKRFCLLCESYDVTATLEHGAIDMLAKIDSYFRVDTQTPLNSGVDGYDLSLAPGYWIQEFKTKAQNIDRAKWIQGWVVNTQASFQLLCLKYKLRNETLPVQGILVSVLEKPKAYIPKRTCKVCDEQYELALWVPAQPGQTLTVQLAKSVKVLTDHLACCPVCGNLQQQKPYEPKKAANPPSYFRIMVTRTDEELETARGRIEEVAGQMQKLRSGQVDPSRLARTTECTGGYYGPCEFWLNHVYNVDTLTDPGFERTRDYVNEVPLVSIEDIH